MKGILFLLIIFASISNAEIVDNIVRDEKKFGDWNIICEEDVMMSNVNCKIFTTFFDDMAKIFIQPNNKVANQIVIMIPNAAENTMVAVRVDKNSVIDSDLVNKKQRYNVIPFEAKKQRTLYRQLLGGDTLFIRFTIRDLQVAGGMKEVTAKIGLAEFSKMITYYNAKVNNEVIKE